MSCWAAAWGPRWAHRADTENSSFGHNSLTASPSERPVQRAGLLFAMLAHCLPVRGWAPKENKSGGSADVHICACVQSAGRRTFRVLWSWKGGSDFKGRIIISENQTRTWTPHSVTCPVAENGLVSLVTSVLAAPKITHQCWQKLTYYMPGF